jgi:hypothetical protein
MRDRLRGMVRLRDFAPEPTFLLFEGREDW